MTVCNPYATVNNGPCGPGRCTGECRDYEYDRDEDQS